MNGYFIAVVATAFAGALVTALSPRSYERQIRLICSLCSVAMIFGMIISFSTDGEYFLEKVESLFSFDDIEVGNYDEIYNSALIATEKENAEKMLKTNIKQALSTNIDAFDVILALDKNGDEYYIERIEVKLYPEALTLDPRAIEKCVKDMLECECVIIYEL